MLTDLQKEKMTHYFNILDFDNNGIIEKDDFTSIAENLNIIWRYKKGSADYEKIMIKYERSWETFRSRVEYKDMEKADMNAWLTFADKYLINGDDEYFEEFIRDIVKDIFDNFDHNDDGYISLDEYIDLFMAYRIEIRYSANSYNKLDLNSDDLLSREELLSAVDEFFKSEEPEAPGNWLFGFWGD